METSNKPPYMFASAAVDYFFRWRWWAAWVAFLPVAIGAFVFAFVNSQQWLTVILSFGIGILTWTLFEYFMHRVIFHYEGNSATLKRMHYVVHGMHHVYPTDPMRVIFPPFSSAIVGSFIAALFFWLLPIVWAAAVFSGFILGYVVYEFMHYGAHHIKWKQRFFFNLKRHHLLHHHNSHYQSMNFGVTTTLWDRIFGTYKS